MLTDAELVAKARQGDKAAFGQLIERYRPMAMRVAQRMLSPAGVAAELTQEALLQAYLSLDALREDARFASWLYGITLNVCRDYLRSQKIDFYPLEDAVGGRWLDIDPLAALEPGPEEIVEAQALHERVLRAVDTLSPANRDAVLLFYYQDLSLRETAAILGISVPALKVRLHRARHHLHDDLLSVYREVRGDRIMIPVKFANVIRVESNVVRDEKPQRWSILMLLDETERRVLPIWIGPSEADALVGGILWTLPNNRFKRPLTWNFVTSILDATGVTLEHVVISALRDDVFYATARIRSGDGVREIDARPSDAIPLALVSNKPLYVSVDEVAPDKWWPVPDDFEIAGSLLGVGTAGLQPEHFAAEPIRLDFGATYTEAELAQFDDVAKEKLRQQHQRVLREYVFSVS